MLELVYRFKQKRRYLLLEKHRTARACRKLIPGLLRAVAELPRPSSRRSSSWQYPARLERGRQAYGFRNFNNYRLRVKVLCS